MQERKKNEIQKEGTVAIMRKDRVNERSRAEQRGGNEQVNGSTKNRVRADSRMH